TPLPDADRERAFARVALQVRMRCGVPEMAAVLHTLETGSPRLFVDNLNLLAQRFQQSPSETGTGLDVSFELVGYLRPGAALEPGTPAPAPLALPAEQNAGQHSDPGTAPPSDAAEPAPAPDAAEEVEHEA
ncbi:MAG TPA: general secretion pathway protein GspM, partial [Stenotrophomonas sp.]|nr:general secretion pathway protein GspM [Stenotrophomonas sp.]